MPNVAALSGRTSFAGSASRGSFRSASAVRWACKFTHLRTKGTYRIHAARAAPKTIARKLVHAIIAARSNADHGSIAARPPLTPAGTANQIDHRGTPTRFRHSAHRVGRPGPRDIRRRNEMQGCPQWGHGYRFTIRQPNAQHQRRRAAPAAACCC